jgi:hypothetical protein
LSDSPAYAHDLPSVHREKGRKSHDPQAQNKVVAMGQAGWTSQEEMSTFSEHTEKCANNDTTAATSIVIEPVQAVKGNVERVLSVMTERQNWRRTDLAKLANIGDDDALQALRALRDADKVIPIDVDEEPKDTFWRRI